MLDSDSDFEEDKANIRNSKQTSGKRAKPVKPAVAAKTPVPKESDQKVPF
jgi:hypothetical protein